MRSERELMLRAGWLHFVEGLTQDAVAQRLGITRVKVNRLAAACRESGLLRITLDAEARFGLEAEKRLIARYGLSDAQVVPTPSDPVLVPTVIGIAAGACVSARLAQGQTLALGWGRTLDSSVGGLVPRHSGGNTVVTLLGSMVCSGTMNSYDIAARYARSLGAECWFLVAPLMADTTEVAEALRATGFVRQALEKAASADLALVGTDDLGDECGLVRLGLLSPEERRSLQAAGAMGNLLGYFLDAEGRQVDHPVNDRRIALDLDLFAKLPLRVLAAGGRRKCAILHAVLSRGLCNVLVTDEDTAGALLEMAEPR